MKTFSLLIAILLTNIQFGYAQNQPEINEIEISTHWEDGTAIIEWSTDREINTSHFLIEKSNDGIHFEIIHNEKAGSSTYRTKEYNFEDAGEINAFTQYRITLVTMEGQRILSEENSDFASAFVK